MRKISILFVLFFSFIFWASANDFENDYTLIDCINWDNDSWVVFDSDKPFSTLKEWIEQTIDYINTNINVAWKEDIYSQKVFNIKVKCSFNDILNKEINLNFNWVKYNNELLIQWVWSNSLVFKDIYFKLWNKAWNIIFKNAIFLNTDKPYFYDYIFPSDKYKRHPFSYGIKIIDSYIRLNDFNIWEYSQYKTFLYKHRNVDWSYVDVFLDHKNYVNKQIIENSIIDIEVDADFNFRVPSFVKNSKLNFKNKTWSWSFNINFIEDGNINTSSNYNQWIFISNKIDLWWLDVNFENTDSIAFLNNKLENFEIINLWSKAVFINNYINNLTKIDISDFYNLYNNIFASWFTDTYDIFNYRKKYSESNIWAKWIWWIYKRLRDNKYFNIDISIASLYKEVTWKNLDKWLGDIYVIFNY